MCSSFFVINLCCFICFLQPQHFEEMPFLTFMESLGLSPWKKSFFSQNKPKMVLEMPN